jgi:cytidylate kinase
MARSKNTEKERSEHVIICVSGMTGSGKSTLAKKIAKKYKLKYYSGGAALMALAVEEGFRHAERGWWESSEGRRFLKKRGADPRFDQAVDNKLLEMTQKGNVVLDSWTMPWLLEEGFKIWLEASEEKRAERIAGRDRISVEEALKALKHKERHTKAIYEKMYGFSLGDDYAPFNFILDADTLNEEEVFQIVTMVLDSLVLWKRSERGPKILHQLAGSSFLAH